MNRHVTLQDIADHLNLSKSSVSMALRDHSRISVKVRQLVRKTAKELGYVQNPLVSANMTNVRRRKTGYAGGLAFLHAYTSSSDWKNSPIFSTYQGARARAAELGYSLECIGLGTEKSPLRNAYRILGARGIQGAVVSPLPPTAASLQWQLEGLALVAIGYAIKRPVLHRVCNHHMQLVELAGQRLHAHGFRRIGFVFSTHIDNRCDRLWSAGLSRWHGHHSEVSSIPPYYYQTDLNEDFKDWIKRHQPDVIVGPHQLIPDWLAKAGMVIPNDIAFAATNLPESDFTTAGILQNHRQVGSVASDTLVAQLNRNERGEPKWPNVTLVPGDWRDGPSLFCSGSRYFTTKSSSRNSDLNHRIKRRAKN